MNVNLSSMSAQISSNIFSKIDTSNKGYLEKTDLSSALSGSDSSSSDSDALFNTLDSDSDGKVTQSELSKGIENLLGQLTSASSGSSSETQGAHKGHNGPPPGEPPSDIDSAGVTKEQAADMANSDDSNLSAMMKKVSENFEAADTNQDGKVSFDESMAYMKSSSSSTSSSTDTSTSSSTSSSSSTSTSLEQLEALRKIAQLIQTYGFGDTSSNSVSVTA